MKRSQEAEASLKKFQFSIRNYEASPENKKALVHAKQQLSDTIQFKYRKSETNKKYIFPKNNSYLHQSDAEEEKQNKMPEVYNLHHQRYVENNILLKNKQSYRLKQKTLFTQPATSQINYEEEKIEISRRKIKLIKNKTDKCNAHLKTQRCEDQTNRSKIILANAKNPLRIKPTIEKQICCQGENQVMGGQISNSSNLDENLQLIKIPSSKKDALILKQRIKTQYQGKNTLNSETFIHKRQTFTTHSQEKSLEKQYFLNSLMKQTTRRPQNSSKSKSKLNLLTKSYMNIKSNELKEKSLKSLLNQNSLIKNNQIRKEHCFSSYSSEHLKNKYYFNSKSNNNYDSNFQSNKSNLPFLKNNLLETSFNYQKFKSERDNFNISHQFKNGKVSQNLHEKKKENQLILKAEQKATCHNFLNDKRKIRMF